MVETGTRKPQKSLTAQFVKAAKTPGKYFDGNGLYLRVDKNGSKFWVQRITIRGKRREMGLGSPTLVSLSEVRDLALENRKLAVSGGDPIQARKERRAVLSFEEAARKVHELHKPTWRNEKHSRDFINSLQAYAFPRIGRIRVADVTTGDMLAVLTPIWTEKPETARRVRQRIGTIMKWAVAQGWRQDNPAESIAQALPKHERGKKHRKAMPYNRVTECIDTVRKSGAGASTKLALEFLILTATRSGETRLSSWEEIDFLNAVWTIPANKMKAKREHRIPLAPRAIEILEQAMKLSDGNGFIFVGAKPGKSLSDMTLSKLVKELGFDADVHGFRTSFRTWAQERSNSPREVAEAALAHNIGNEVEMAYARSDLFEKRRKLMDGWASYLSHATKNVVRMG